LPKKKTQCFLFVRGNNQVKQIVGYPNEQKKREKKNTTTKTPRCHCSLRQLNFILVIGSRLKRKKTIQIARPPCISHTNREKTQRQKAREKGKFYNEGKKKRWSRKEKTKV
jgi:hypothetical protein